MPRGCSACSTASSALAASPRHASTYADPTNLKQIGELVELTVGHTTSCVDGCNYGWTGGPARHNDLAYLGPFTPGGRGDGRPIWVTNLKDPAHPEGQVQASGVDDGNIALMTEEDFTEPCDQGGRIVAADITSSLGGEGATNSTPEHPFRMTALDSYHPFRDANDSAAPITSCSAHYFELSGSTLAAGWYGQGLRAIDGSNARDLRQVGYYYVTGTDPTTNPSSLSWDTAWHGDLIYLFDMSRGIEILRLKGGAARAARLPTVREPRARTDRLAAVPTEGLTAGSLVCPLFTTPS
jgi:hypothetical protein